MGLTRITAPTLEPLTLQQVKNHLRVEHADDDSVIEPLIAAALGQVDGRDAPLGRALMTQQWDWTLDGFPPRRNAALLVPLPPLRSVEQITYLDTAGVSQTWTPAEYRVDIAETPGRLTPAFGFDWPQAQAVTASVTVSFTAGYGASPQDVPEPIRWAMLLMIGHWYSNREAVNVGNIVTAFPMSVDALLAPYRIWSF
jgi:uncharacterized phiE125 gp8 family phage protein